MGTMRNSDINDKSITDSVLLEQYWSYFQLQSSQRIQMINFYITIEIVLIGAYFAILSIESIDRWIVYAVSLFITFTSIAFYGLDKRTRKLIHWCNECILSIEKKYTNIYKDDELLLTYSLSKRNECFFNGTYTMWFDLFFIVIGLFGLTCFFIIS